MTDPGPALGYQLPAAAHTESQRAHALVAAADDVEWIDDGAVLHFPADPATSEAVDAFVRDFGRRHPVRLMQRTEGDDARIALRITGPGTVRWLKHSLARNSPTLGARLQRRARLSERVRTLTRGLRVLPSFFIIGAPRCGTTSLFHSLMRHPSIEPPARKELAFFNVLYREGLPWYRAQFPGAWQRMRARLTTGAFATCDATPTYLFHPHVAGRIRESVPDARLIVLLRDPVERAWSHYHWALSMGYELLPFAQAVERERTRVDGELVRMLEDEAYLSFPRSYLSYLGMGRYAEQLRAWAEVFPREQLLVLCVEDLRDAPGPTLARALEFLGLPSTTPPTGNRRNEGRYPHMDDALRRALRDDFAPHDAQLEEFLGWTPAWRRTPD